MAHFLRDQLLTNLTINEERLTQINGVFEAQSLTLPERANPQPSQPQRLLLSYIIRFDNKGYRTYLFPQLLNYFRQANYVERILFTLESERSLLSNRSFGSVMELKLDDRDPLSCAILVTSDDDGWVDASFRAAEEVLSECKNWHAWIRTTWTAFVIQMLGVLAGFAISLWGGRKIAPYLSIENAFLLSFFLVLLLFSNLWIYINQLLHIGLNRLFPNIKFYRDRDQSHWLTRGVIVAIVAGTAWFVINWVFSYVGRILGGFISQTP